MERGVTEICLLSGVHPDFTIDTYCDLISWVHEIGPNIHLHAFSPDEVSHAASVSNLSSVEVLETIEGGRPGVVTGNRS